VHGPAAVGGGVNKHVQLGVMGIDKTAVRDSNILLLPNC